MSQRTGLSRLTRGPGAGETPPAARWMARGAIAAFALVLGAALLRDEASLDALEAAVRAEKAQAPVSSAEPRRPAAPAPRDAVPADEFAAASAGGVLALEALAVKYPKDPAIFRALMLRHAIPPPYHAAALSAAKRLLELDPGAAADGDVQRVVSSAVTGPAEAATAALDLMASSMGRHGADLLYDIATGSSAVKDQAMQRLGEAKVLERATPALRIAYELRAATTCKARQALLERAAEDGDQRAADVLESLIATKPRGCGFLGLSRCPGQCASIAKEIKEALKAIEARVGPAPKGAASGKSGTSGTSASKRR